MHINKVDCIVAAIGIIPVMLITRFDTPKSIFIYYAFILIYLLAVVFIKEKRPSLSDGRYEKVSRTRIHFAWAVDWTVFFGFYFFYSKVLRLIPVSHNSNRFIPVIYILTMQNVLKRSIGFKVFGLYPDNIEFTKKLKIFLINLMLLSGMFLIGAHEIWSFLPDKIVKSFSTVFISMSLINYAVRVNILKSKSLWEMLFGLQTLAFIRKK